jgi:hypothetical protein
MAVFVSGVVLALVGWLGNHPPSSAPLPSHPFQAVGNPGPVHALTSSVPDLPPDELDIPSLGIMAPLVSEVIADHALTVPSDVHTVGLWSGGGELDGTTGTVLLAGHVNFYNQGNGALYGLSTITPGTTIFVSSATDQVTSWTARSLSSYPKTNLPQGIFTPSGPRRLVIVTCGGAFDSTTGHYLDNVVLTADPAADADASHVPRAVPGGA